ncbi:MAG TPA: aminotransferase class IV [Alcaligenes sp.]|nr:aminotransferase class IV [Alcaligenes sp.]HRL27099.1 aminotransferase class IV [Alcaligenes sp.]
MTQGKPELIETLRVDPDGQIPLLELHLERIARSCRELNYVWDAQIWLQAMHLALAQAPSQVALRLRVLWQAQGAATAQAEPLPALAGPLHLRLSATPLPALNPLLAHKTTHRPWYQHASRLLADDPSLFDVIFVDDRNLVCEGSRSNIYIQDDQGVWWTPTATGWLLPGVQRRALLNSGLAREAEISLDALKKARALRISNALRGWQDALLLQETV